MRILLDTPIYLWWLMDSTKLSSSARDIIQDATEVYVSSASIWEAGIKINSGKLEADLDKLIDNIQASGLLNYQSSQSIQGKQLNCLIFIAIRLIGCLLLRQCANHYAYLQRITRSPNIQNWWIWYDASVVFCAGFIKRIKF